MEAQKKIFGNTDLPNTVLAEKLRHFIPLKKATTEEFPQSLSVVPAEIPLIEAVKPALEVVAVSKQEVREEPKKQIAKPRKNFVSRRMLAKSVQRVGVTQCEIPGSAIVVQGNVSVWLLIQRNSQRLVAHISDLLQRKEKPLLVISVKDGGKDFVVLDASLIRNDSEVRFRVSRGMGRLFEAFPKNTVFFSDELSCRVCPHPSREQIVREFMMELHVIMHQQFMVECKG